MKYYTKEFCERRRTLEELELWGRVSDEEWTDESIQKLHNKVLQDELHEYEEDALDGEFDEVRERKSLEREYQRRLETQAAWLPDWILKKVDARILALEKLPRSIGKLVDQEKKDIEITDEEYRKIIQEQFSFGKIPYSIRTILSELHGIVSIKQVGSDLYVLTSFFWVFHFSDVQLLEDEFPNGADGLVPPIICEIELYVLEDGRYELHWLIDDNESETNRFHYETIRFQNVTLDESFDGKQGQEMNVGEFSLRVGVAKSGAIYYPWIVEELDLGPEVNRTIEVNRPIVDEHGCGVFEDKESAKKVLEKELAEMRA